MKYIDVEILGKSFEVKPTFEFIDRVEQRFDLSTMVRNMTCGTPKFSDVAWIITSAIRAAGKDIDYYQVGNEVMADLGKYAKIAGELVAAAFGAGPEKKSQTPAEKPEAQ